MPGLLFGKYHLVVALIGPQVVQASLECGADNQALFIPSKDDKSVCVYLEAPTGLVLERIVQEHTPGQPECGRGKKSMMIEKLLAVLVPLL